LSRPIDFRLAIAHCRYKNHLFKDKELNHITQESRFSIRIDPNVIECYYENNLIVW